MITIEKIDKIRDLLIVPSVDEQPKLAINQMKILNLLVELRAEVEQLTIPAVVGRSEQLAVLVDWLRDNYSIDIPDRVIDEYKRYNG